MAAMSGRYSSYSLSFVKVEGDGGTSSVSPGGFCSEVCNVEGYFAQLKTQSSVECSLKRNGSSLLCGGFSVKSRAPA